MENLYLVSTMNNLKNTQMVKKDCGDMIEIQYEDKLIPLHKGQYIVFELSSGKFQAVISKGMFEDFYKIIGRAFMQFEDTNGRKYKYRAGLVCSLNL